ncbi:MAG: pyridoxamine 5'-phosphate oxidase family protein [Dermatophilaceae bacterium]
MTAPRTVDQRIMDARKRLEHDVDAWVATTSPDRPWLIPLSLLWHQNQLLFATSASSPTAVNIGLVPRVRVALGGVRDVVIIDGDADLAPSATLSSAEVDAYRAKHNSDPRTWADTVIRVAPLRIQVWREENELAGRTLMRNGVWVSSL